MPEDNPATLHPAQVFIDLVCLLKKCGCEAVGGVVMAGGSGLAGPGGCKLLPSTSPLFTFAVITWRAVAIRKIDSFTILQIQNDDSS
jgi:hypothetical protein